MFEKLGDFFNRMKKPEVKELTSKDAAKERLHLVLMQDRANVSVEFLELMKQEIIDVIKKYIVIDESAIDVRLTSQEKDDGTNGEPTLYASIPIINIKNDTKAEKINDGTLTYKHGELEKADKSTLQPEENVVISNESELNEPTTELVTEPEVISTPVTEPVSELAEELVTEAVPEQVSEPEIEIKENNDINKPTRGETEPAIVIELAEANTKEAETEPQTENASEDENIIEAEAEDASDIMEVVEESKEEPAQKENEAVEKVIEEEPAVIENKEETDTVEPVLDFVEDEDDDDDVTFDDLLKKAEEEEQTEKAQTAKKKKPVKQKKR